MILSSRGNHYIFVQYNYDKNSIHTQLLKNRQTQEITEAWKACHEHIQQHGASPTLHILDNECSSTNQKAFRKYNVNFQIVPLYTHRRNFAKRVIRTFNNHICAGLASCDPSLLSQEWGCLIPQAVLTLNLIRSPRTNTSLYFHAAINSNFDFNATPLAPPGTKVLVHEAASNRPSFSTNAVNGYYIGPSLNHYCCYHCYIPNTASTRH